MDRVSVHICTRDRFIYPSILNTNMLKDSKHTEETKRKMSESQKGRKLSEEHKQKISCGLKIAIKEGRRSIPSCKGMNVHSDDYKNKLSIRMKGNSYGSKNKGNHNIGKNTWKKGGPQPPQFYDSNRNPEHIELRLKGLFKRPTSLEKEMIDIIKRNDLPYKYVGDGSFIIGYKNPDFIRTDNKKVCIEVANTIHHAEDYEKNRKEHFKKWGWECIVFRTNKLNEEEVMRCLKNVR